MRVYSALVSCSKCYTRVNGLILEAAKLDKCVRGFASEFRAARIEVLLNDAGFRRNVGFNDSEGWAHKIAALRVLEQAPYQNGIPAREINGARADCKFCDYSSPVIRNRLYLGETDIPSPS